MFVYTPSSFACDGSFETELECGRGDGKAVWLKDKCEKLPNQDEAYKHQYWNYVQVGGEIEIGASEHSDSRADAIEYPAIE